MSRGHYGTPPSLQWGVKPNVPTSRRERQSSRSPDHFIRLKQERRGDGEAERLGGLEVDDEFEFHGLLHGQVRRLRTFQYFVHVGGGAAEEAGFSDLCVWLVFMRLSRLPLMKVLATQEVRSRQSASNVSD